MPTDSPAEPFNLTPADVAAMAGVTDRAVRNWATGHKLTGWRTPGGHWRFRQSDVDVLLDSMLSQATS